MNFKSLAIAAVAIVGATATPASAALRTVNFIGAWVGFASGSTWTNTDPLSLSVTYDDTAIAAVTTPNSFDLTAPGSALSLSIGSETWTLADFRQIFSSVPFITLGLPQGPEVFFTGVNASTTTAFTGVALLGLEPNTFIVGIPGDTSGCCIAFGKFTAVPEPANWALLIAGFGLTGAVMRRRRMALAA
jgi:hypothetical protein